MGFNKVSGFVRYLSKSMKYITTNFIHMEKGIFLFTIVLLTTVISCEKENAEPDTTQNEKIEETQENVSDTIPHSTLAEELQGTWREPEYPFRRAEFKDSTVKFTEEGVIEPPSFKPFEISNECPFLPDLPINNETYFVRLENEICEKISVQNDTLRFRGVESDYTIVYERME